MVNFQIIIPGLKLKDFKLFAPIFGNHAFGVLIFLFLLVQRVQMAISVNLSAQEVQKLDSMRWNAKQMLNNSFIVPFHTTRSMVDSIPFSYSKISGLSSEERDEVLRNEQFSIMSAPRAKVFNPNQIDESTLDIHRKGLVLSYIGLAQSTPIYSPPDIIKNAYAMTIDFQAVYDYCNQLCSLLGYDLDAHISEIIEEGELFSDEDTFRSIEPWQKAARVLDYYLFKNNSLSDHDSTNFADGINISPTNLLPVEKEFSIKRTTPAQPIEIIAIDESDPISKAIQERTVELNASLKNKSKAQRGSKQSSRSGNARQKNKQNKDQKKGGFLGQFFSGNEK